MLADGRGQKSRLLATSMPASTVVGMVGGIEWYVDTQISMNTCLLLVADESSTAFLMPPSNSCIP